MCVPYVRFAFQVIPKTVGCPAIGNAVLFTLMSRLLLYFAGSGVNRVQVVCLDLVGNCYVLSRQKL